MKEEWRQGSLGKLKGPIPDLVRGLLIDAGAEEKEHREHEQWRFVLEEGLSRATVTLYKSGTCELAGRGAATDTAEDLVSKIIHEDKIQRSTDVPVPPPSKKQKWYAIAEPIQNTYDDYEKCKQLLAEKGLSDLVPVRVSSQKEGWLTVNEGIRLDPGRYAFTDASTDPRSKSVSLAAVIVEMTIDEEEPACSHEKDFNESEFVEKRNVTGVSTADLVDAFLRFKHIFGEMLALYLALQEQARLEPVPKLTIVHDYLGVSAWSCAAAPRNSFVILPGFTDAAETAKTWGPATDKTVGKVVEACWQLATENNLFLEFRHQPGHRSEAAGVNHFVRFNNRAHKRALEAARR